jgi:hypothetical protein
VEKTKATIIPLIEKNRAPKETMIISINEETDELIPKLLNFSIPDKTPICVAFNESKRIKRDDILKYNSNLIDPTEIIEKCEEKEKIEIAIKEETIIDIKCTIVNTLLVEVFELSLKNAIYLLAVDPKPMVAKTENNKIEDLKIANSPKPSFPIILAKITPEISRKNFETVEPKKDQEAADITFLNKGLSWANIFLFIIKIRD